MSVVDDIFVSSSIVVVVVSVVRWDGDENGGGHGAHCTASLWRQNLAWGVGVRQSCVCLCCFERLAANWEQA
jgi:hypothetical protein